MRIAVLTRTAARIGGVEVYLERALPHLIAAGHEVRLIVEDGGPGALGGVEAQPLAAGLGELAGVDVAWVHGLADPDLEGRVLASAPAVAFAHDYQASCLSGAKSFRRPAPEPCARRCGAACLALYYARGCGGRSPRTLLRSWLRQRARVRALARYAGVVTLSEHMRREVIRHGVDSERAVALPPLPPPLAGTAREAPWSAEVAQLLCLSRLEPEKGVQVLLSALPLLVARLGRRVELNVAGEGRARAALERAAARLNPRAQVRFLGRVPGAQVDQLMEESHLLVLPSLWPEPAGLVGLEAGLRGLPVAAFRSGGVPEWLLEGENGALAAADPPTADGLAAAMSRCLEDPSRHAELRAGARRLARDASPERHLSALSAALRAAARNEARGR